MDASKPEPPPTYGHGEIVLDHVITDLKARAEFGAQKYGRYLETNDGRDTLMDVYQEALDLVMYLRKEIMERELRGNDHAGRKNPPQPLEASEAPVVSNLTDSWGRIPILARAGRVARRLFTGVFC